LKGALKKAGEPSSSAVPMGVATPLNATTPDVLNASLRIFQHNVRNNYRNVRQAPYRGFWAEEPRKLLGSVQQNLASSLIFPPKSANFIQILVNI
jgi:hypothetical protein